MIVLKKIRNLLILSFLLMLILFILGFASKLGFAYKILSVFCLALLAAECFALFRLTQGLLVASNEAVMKARRDILATVGSQLQHDLRNSLMVIDMTLENIQHNEAPAMSDELVNGAKSSLQKIKVMADELGEAAKIVQLQLESFEISKSLQELVTALNQRPDNKQSNAANLILPKKSSNGLKVRGDSLKFLEACFQIASTLLKSDEKSALNVETTRDNKTFFIDFKTSTVEKFKIDYPEYLDALKSPAIQFGKGGESLKVWKSARTIEAMGGALTIADKFIRVTLPLAKHS